MKVTRDVIVDLWPVYESGAASADTQALVDGFLKDDPEFARRLREGEETMNTLLAAVPVMPPPDVERASLARTQLLLRLRFYFLAAAAVIGLLAVTLRQYRTFSASAAVLSLAACVGLVILTRGRRLTIDEAVVPEAAPLNGWRLACAAMCLTSFGFSMVVRTFREYSVPLALLSGLAWLGLEIAARMRRPGA